MAYPKEYIKTRKGKGTPFVINSIRLLSVVKYRVGTDLASNGAKFFWLILLLLGSLSLVALTVLSTKIYFSIH